MLRSLIVLAFLTGAVLLVRPKGRTKLTGVRGWRWLVLGLGIQLLWVRGISTRTAELGLLHWLPSLALLPALYFVWLNRRYRGLWLLALGAALNLLVMAGNGGLMPISPSSLHAMGADATHTLAGTPLAVSKDRLLPDSVASFAPLGDRLIYSVGGLHVASSIGDLLVALGCLLTLAEEMCQPSRGTSGSPRAAMQRGPGLEGALKRPA